jgi:invasion protein IalB
MISMPMRSKSRALTAAFVAFALCAFAGALSSAAYAAAAAPPPDAQAAAAQPTAGAQPGGPTDTESFGDWVVRCFPVKGPAPCDMLQVSVAKNNQQQRVLSLSFAYVPERDAYGLQVIVPLGISVQKGLAVGPENGPMGKLHYTRCENDGCYAEALVDEATVSGLGAAGTKTTVSITPYGKKDSEAITVSLNGFNDALAKLKVLSKQKASALPPANGTPAR